MRISMPHDNSVICVPSLTLYSLSTVHAATENILYNAHISLPAMCLFFFSCYKVILWFAESSW
jgi:hypothetical protein